MSFALRLAALGGGRSNTTWNPSDAAAGLSFSGGNLTVTKPLAGAGNDALVRGYNPKTAGKWHFEITVVATGAQRPGVGIANASQTLLGTNLDFIGGQGGNSIGLFGNGEVRFNGAQIFIDSALAFDTPGRTVAIEVDLDNDRIYFQVVGRPRSSGFNIAAISGPVFPCLDLLYAGDSSTANFGGTTFAITPTSGYGAWD